MWVESMAQFTARVFAPHQLSPIDGVAMVERCMGTDGVVRYGQGERLTVLVGGRFTMSENASEPIARLLPPLIRVRADSTAVSDLRAALDLVCLESVVERPVKLLASRSLSNIAKEIGMSRTSFSERFKVLVGIPPLDYLIGWRVSVAKAALTHGQKSIATIAEEIGYGSESAFSSAFKQVTGLSPTRFQIDHRR